jgi:hypothetical protein
VIRLRHQPLLNEGGIAVLRGNLAPAGAIIKPAAASPHLIQHRGRGLVFDSVEDFHTPWEGLRPKIKYDGGASPNPTNPNANTIDQARLTSITTRQVRGVLLRRKRACRCQWFRDRRTGS